MKTMLKSTAIALAVSVGASSASAEGEVLLYNWFEYMPQELLEKFEAETGIKVTMDTFDSNEAMLATMKSGAIGTYDIVVPTDYMVGIMAEEGFLDTIAEGELKNKGNIEPQWVDVSFDPGRKHSIPYQWGSTSFGVNRDVYQGDINTTAILFDPPTELQGRINVLDSQGEVLVLGLMHLGYEQCTSDRNELRALNDLLQSAKVHWASFSSETSKEVIVSGDAAAGMLYDGFSIKAREEGANIEYAFPVQGYIAWMDNFVLMKDAPNRANALAFLDFMLEPENSGILSNFAQYNSGIAGVGKYLDANLASQPEKNPPSEAGKPQFLQACDEEVQAVYDKIWTDLKN